MAESPYLKQSDERGEPLIVMPADDEGNVRELTVPQAYDWLASFENLNTNCEDGCRSYGSGPKCLWCAVYDLLDGLR